MRVLICYLFLSLTAYYAMGKKQERILLIADASIAMADTLPSGQTKYQLAMQFINKLTDSMYTTNSDVAFGMRLFGHQDMLAAGNCKDSKLEVRYSQDNRTQTMLRLASLHPRGNTAAVYALQQARYDISDTLNYRYTIVFVSSGARYCSGMLCDAAETLKNVINGDTYILPLTTDAHSSDIYQCIGDNYAPIGNETEADRAVAVICRKYRRSRNLIQELSSLPAHVPQPTPAATKPVATKDITVTTPPPVPPTYLYINTVYAIENIKMKYRTSEAKPFADVNRKIQLPMRDKERIEPGIYRFHYTITINGKTQGRIKEFFIAPGRDNAITLD